MIVRPLARSLTDDTEILTRLGKRFWLDFLELYKILSNTHHIHAPSPSRSPLLQSQLAHRCGPGPPLRHRDPRGRWIRPFKL